MRLANQRQDNNDFPLMRVGWYFSSIACNIYWLQTMTSLVRRLEVTVSTQREVAVAADVSIKECVEVRTTGNAAFHRETVSSYNSFF